MLTGLDIESKANLDLDAQAKGLGEFIRSRHADVPEELLPPTA